jgi:hypothetical protein
MARVYESVIKIGASISKAFRGDALGAAGALKQLAASTKQLQAAEKAAAAYKKLGATVASSKARYDQASEALKRLEAAERAAGGATKESTAWRKAGEKEVAKAAKEFDRATKAAEKHADALRKLGIETSRLESGQRRLAAASKFGAARERLFGARKDADPVPLLSKARGQIGGLASQAMMLGTAAAGAGVAMAGLVAKAIHTGDEIGDTAEKLGIGAKALQELRYGAKQSGAETEDLDKSLGKMLVTIGRFKAAKAKGGGGAAAIPGMQMLGTGGSEDKGGGGESDPFKRIGLNAKQLASMKPDDQIRKIAEGLRKLKTHADQAAVAQAIFGKSGVAMLPMLKKGAAGIDELAKKANKFGGVMSDDAVKAAGEADEAFNDMQMAVTGAATTLGSALLPTATRVFGEVSRWVAANRGQIQQWASTAATWIETKAIPAFLKIADMVSKFGAKALWLVEGAAKLAGGFDNLAIVVAAVRLAPLALTLGQIGVSGIKAAVAIAQFAAASMTSMAPLLAAAAPLLAIAAAAGAVAVAIVRINDAVKELGGAGAVWQDLKDFVGRGGMDHMTRTGGGNRDLFEAQQAENQRNLALARSQGQLGPAMPMTGAAAAGFGNIQINPVINAGEGARKEVSRGMDKAKAAALEAFDRRESNRRRLSYAE